MRDILFRGKRIDNGEWIYGWYYQKQNPLTRDGRPIKHYISDLPPFGAEIDSETVGRYTGLKDKNGKLIFEGDILQIIGYGEVIEHCSIGYGIYDSFGGSYGIVGFFLCWERDIRQERKYANLSYWVNEREAVCIGNIHDK